MKHDVELITWIDSTQLFGWDITSAKLETSKTADLKCRSVGIVIHESDDRVVLAQSLSEDSAGTTIIIPKVCITKREVLCSVFTGV